MEAILTYLSNQSIMIINDFIETFAQYYNEKVVPNTYIILREYSEQSGLNLERDTLQTVSGLLTGYPTQIFWAVTVLNEYGSEEITSHLHEIVDYSSDKAATILRHFETNEKAINFLAYLSRFEILSADMLNSAFEIDPELQQIYEEFRALSICNLYGSNGEIIRVSDIIRDYVNRLKHELSPEYKKIIDEMVSASLDQKFFEDSDLATYYGTIKQKIVNGAKTNSTAILPSLYIKSIVEFYNNKRYDYFKNALIIRRARLMKLQNKPSREINLELANLKNISPLIKDKISQGLC